MAIPLIQNVEKQDINTSIIAIRRQLEQLYNALGVTENTVVTNNIGGGDNTPLGTIVSYLGTENPANGEWLICDGSTFDASQYPSLATFLGGNVLPEVFDHSRPSNPENVNGDSGFTLTTTNSVAPYDGVINFGYNQAHARRLYINDVMRSISGNNGGPNTSSYEVKKGDLVRVDNNLDLSQSYNNVIWYKSHKLIKAVSPTDQYTPPSTEMQQIEQYVDNGLNTRVPNISDFPVLTLYEGGNINNTLYSWTATVDCFVSISQNWLGSSQQGKHGLVYINGNCVEDRYFYGYGTGTSDSEIRDLPTIMTSPVFVRSGQTIQYKHSNYDGATASYPRIRVWTKN